MKTIVSILIILITAKHSYALNCIACEASDTEETCEFSYKCPKGSKYCETLVSKVEGSYAVVLSCATDEKCKAEPMLEGGLDECSYDEDNTECYTCCKGDDCNTLESALKKLPDDIFESEKPTKKGKKVKGRKGDDEEEESDDEEDEDEEEKKEEKKKSNGKNKKSKNKKEEIEEEEETDEKNLEEPEEAKADEQVDKKSENDSETVAETGNESPENGTAIDQTNIDNKTVVATNLTANATDQGTGNNNDTRDVMEPLDPNIQEIERTLNETVGVIEVLQENLDNDGNAENIGNGENTGFDTANVDLKADDEGLSNGVYGMEENKVENGVEFNAPRDMNEEGSNIISEGENANEAGEPNEFSDPSSSSKYQISEILFFATFTMILIQLF